MTFTFLWRYIFRIYFQCWGWNCSQSTEGHWRSKRDSDSVLHISKSACWMYTFHSCFLCFICRTMHHQFSVTLVKWLKFKTIIASFILFFYLGILYTRRMLLLCTGKGRKSRNALNFSMRFSCHYTTLILWEWSSSFCSMQRDCHHLVFLQMRC